MKYFVGNWKLNPVTLKEAKKIYLSIAKIKKSKHATVIVCPPALFIPELKKQNKKHIFLGAQDVFYENQGAYTGALSPEMFAQFSVKYSIIGHSEVRERGDTNSIVNKKVLALLRANITPIVCIGEKNRDDAHWHFHFVKEQLLDSLMGISKKQMENIIIVYEPVWAIGKNAERSATSEECQEMIIFIRKILADLYDNKIATSAPILYGASVSEDNAHGFLEESGADGLLMGRVSLDVKSFTKIITI